MRDWINTKPNCSFRGLPFYVEREILEGAGRKVAVYEFAKAEDHDTDDMGIKTKRFRFSAYIVGDNADANAQAFVAMCDQAGDGELQLSMLGTFTVKCTNCSASSEKMAQGKVDLDLEFVESGNGSAFSVTALGDRIAASLQSGMGAAIMLTISGFPG